MPKFQYAEKPFNQTYNWTVAKILDHNRFLGLVTHDDTTTLAVGMNSEDSGVTIDHIVQVEDIPHLHCFDVEETHNHEASQTYAMIDCLGTPPYNSINFSNIRSRRTAGRNENKRTIFESSPT